MRVGASLSKTESNSTAGMCYVQVTPTCSTPAAVAMFDLPTAAAGRDT